MFKISRNTPTLPLIIASKLIAIVSKVSIGRQDETVSRRDFVGFKGVTTSPSNDKDTDSVSKATEDEDV